MSTARARPGTALVLSIVAVVVIVGASVAGVVATTTTSRLAHPDQWDPRITDLAQFVERRHGERFDHPVQVDFLTPDEYSQASRAETADLNEDDKNDLIASEGELRALGLATGDVDLFEAISDLSDSGTLAFYDPDTKRVAVRGTDTTVEQRVTLVHELTHALQDQKFDISTARTDELPTDGEKTAFRALAEGDANRIESAYVEQLSDDDRDEYVEANRGSVERAETQLGSVPQALQAVQQMPYLLGPPFVEVLAANGGNEAVADAFESPPTTEEQLYDPPVFARREGAMTVARPDLPEGVDDATDDGEFGSTSWYLMLAERINPIQALHAVDGWGGDAFIAYEADGRTCMRMAFEGDAPVDDDEMRTALQDWIAAMPEGSASVLSQTSPVVVQACDPGQGKEAPLTNRSVDAIALAGLRSAEMQAAVQYANMPVDRAFRYGDCVVNRLGFGWVHRANSSRGELSSDLITARNDAEQACLDTAR